MSDIVDLDVLRPKAKYVKLGGTKIDVSFVPVGITFDIDRLMNQLAAIDMKDVEKGGEASQKAFDIAVDICVAFCSHNHPELNREWFVSNVDATQVKTFADTIQDTLKKTYSAVADYGEGEGKN